ncbi:hypothetical protein C7S18_09515 [Ahniella affigens]|uniref:Uncharacterized protein n=1 Tax=Ahniella affigens TaxID=2021234 RepID=A0A2P1PRD7_9GAMM|nr:LodA/GoxA family CTQ-dependent oxidase [Ahniella affigens]AVP97417.1 hypothetical protein C7S18_09515 [Ahniella affigens]
MPYAIYPPIGFARIGNSPDYYLSPEAPGSLGIQVHPDGSETEVHGFKDNALRMKRRAVRFHLFEVDSAGLPVPASLPTGTVVHWRISVANRKDSVRRPPTPPSVPRSITDDPMRQDRAMRASAELAGALAPRASLIGHYQSEPVLLGEVFTDGHQRLIVLGGLGRTATLKSPPPPLGGSFYTNPDWFDDVCDGLIEASIELPGQAPQAALSAWVVTAPPDFAPGTSGVVTLYDVIRQVGIQNALLPAVVRPWFETDIRPMIERAANLRWVDATATWSQISTDWTRLASPLPSEFNLRKETAALVREVEANLRSFSLRDWQNSALDAYAQGIFESGAEPNRGFADVLTRTALDTTLGQGFFPGIEAGINMTERSLYSLPFEYRLSSTVVPGDLTAHMAQPWQADFLKCGEGWWPAQRPAVLRHASGANVDWLRPPMSHVALVDNAMKLGVATPDGNGAFVEQGRDPALGP